MSTGSKSLAAYRDHRWESYARWQERVHGRATPERDERWAEEDAERAARIEVYRTSIGFQEDGPKGSAGAAGGGELGRDDHRAAGPFRREVFTLDSGADRLDLLCPACAAGVENAAPTVLFDARGYICNRCGLILAALEP